MLTFLCVSRALSVISVYDRNPGCLEKSPVPAGLTGESRIISETIGVIPDIGIVKVTTRPLTFAWDELRVEQDQVIRYAGGCPGRAYRSL